jgi:iron complex transport system substrate-binding protein
VRKVGSSVPRRSMLGGAVALLLLAATPWMQQPALAQTKPSTTLPITPPTARPKLPVVVPSVGNELVEVSDVSRIVVLNGDVNEILYALGMGDRIVANDTTGYYPEASKQKPKIGYQRQLSAETILSFRPTLVIGNTDAGPPAVLDQLRSAKVPLVIVPAGDSVFDSSIKIRRVGAAVGLAKEGEALGDKVRAQINAVQKKWLPLTNRFEPKALFLYLRGPRVLLMGGSGTRAAAMLEAAGVTDAGSYLAGVKGYVPITSEAMVKANPDAIVTLEDGLASVGGVDGVLKLPGVALTKAGKERRIHAFDDLKLLELGPRTPEALDELFEALYKPVARA